MTDSKYKHNTVSRSCTFFGKCPQLTALRTLSSLKAASTLQQPGALWVLPIKISFVTVSSGPTLQPSDVFEQPVPASQRKIEFHITVPDVAAGIEENGRGQRDVEDTGTYSFTPSAVSDECIVLFWFD